MGDFSRLILRIFNIHLGVMTAGLIALLPTFTWAALTFNSPPEGQVLEPGTSLLVSVFSSDPSVDRVLLVPQIPLAQFELKKAPSNSRLFVGNLSVGTHVPPAVYQLRAFGFTRDGKRIASSPPVQISVVPTAEVGIEVRPAMMFLRFPGDSQRISVLYQAQGSEVSGMNTEGLKIESENTSIAQVGANGDVYGVAPGKAEISVQYSDPRGGIIQRKTVTVNVEPNPVRGDLDNNGVVDMNDLNILKSALNEPARGRLDARDLNHDGTINVLDLRILVTLCMFRRCALRQ